MSQFDLSLDQLEGYRPALRRPLDFAEFWQSTLAQHGRAPLNVRVHQLHNEFVLIDTFDVEFAGFDGDPIKAWLWMPRGAPDPLPAVVEYVGYSGGRGYASAPSRWALSGYAHLLMDTRGQGSGGSNGHTPDEMHGPAAPAVAGFMTRGIRDRETYYYRRLFVDAVRAVEVVRSLPQIDPRNVFVAGGSQGGGVSLAVSGLVRGLAGVMAEVPFLSHFERAITITNSEPYAELARYLASHRADVELVLDTLSNFDVANFVDASEAPALFSVGLMDEVTPPSTVFAAYNRYAGPKGIRVYPFNGHEGGGALHSELNVAWANSRLKQ